VQQLLDEGYDSALHHSVRVGEHTHEQGGLVVQQPAQTRRPGDHRVDVAAGAGGVQDAFGSFGPARALASFARCGQLSARGYRRPVSGVQSWNRWHVMAG
jgi:hypothetical protein